jgi:hypothetical protein
MFSNPHTLFSPKITDPIKLLEQVKKDFEILRKYCQTIASNTTYTTYARYSTQVVPKYLHDSDYLKCHQYILTRLRNIDPSESETEENKKDRPKKDKDMIKSSVLPMFLLAIQKNLRGLNKHILNSELAYSESAYSELESLNEIATMFFHALKNKGKLDARFISLSMLLKQINAKEIPNIPCAEETNEELYRGIFNMQLTLIEHMLQTINQISEGFSLKILKPDAEVSDQVLDIPYENAFVTALSEAVNEVGVNEAMNEVGVNEAMDDVGVSQGSRSRP